jgi:hypothetical protein
MLSATPHPGYGPREPEPMRPPAGSGVDRVGETRHPPADDAGAVLPKGSGSRDAFEGLHEEIAYVFGVWPVSQSGGGSR